MCGLVGLFDTTGRRGIDGGLLRRMNDSLSHRGPDGAGEHIAPGLGLGHRRLAIIDVSGGHQPMYNEDETVTVVFNGEIYNFQDLVRELESLGHRFRSHCDTEVIVHAWEQWGADAVKRFRGMFAFALWDEPRETLVLARDHLGKKPLYWAPLSDGQMVFGSELKAVMTHPGVPRALDPLAIEEFFAFGYIPDPRSIYKAVRKLPPAHRMVWRRGQAPIIDAYWDLRFDGGPLGDLDDAGTIEDALVASLRDATRARLISDVPLGAFLSGGVDSSGVVALMAGLSPTPVKTFSIGFDEHSHDESAYAARIAQRYATDHHTRRVDPNDISLIDRLATIYDEPFGDSSAMPTFRVCELARTRVTVALSGDGGDEVFAGYRRYAMHQHLERVRRVLPPLSRPVFGLLGRAYPKADWAPRWMRARTTFQELGVDSAQGYARMVSALSDDYRARLFSSSLRRDLQGYRGSEVVLRHMAAAQTDDSLSRLQYADLKTWLAGGILVKVDRASMANSLEVRAPLLDVGLIEWASGLAPSAKIRGTQGKVVLKRALEPHVDDDILYRPKRGFSMPLTRWFRGPLAERMTALTTSPWLAESGLFNTHAIRQMVEGHRSGRSDHSVGLWLLLMFEAFLKANDAGHPR